MAKPRTKNVNVVYNPDTVPPFGLQDSANHPLKHEISFHNGGCPGVMVYFNLLDPTNTGIEFKEALNDALWVQAAAQVMPPPPCPIPCSTWEGFVPLSVEEDQTGRRTQLIVYCRNRLQQQKFRFTLWFRQPAAGGGWQDIDYDPIGDGNNGLRL